jgi:hypothetical protein
MSAACCEVAQAGNSSISTRGLWVTEFIMKLKEII